MQVIRASSAATINQALKLQFRQSSSEEGRHAAMEMVHEGRDGLIADRYALREVIGRGGMGEVWSGEDLLLGRPVAVKLMHTDLAYDAVAQARFHREARAAALFNHPCIAAVYDAGTLPFTPPRPYLVMEHVHGQTIAQCLRTSPPPAHEAVRWAAGVLEALEYAHAAGIVHRDIKPANVMITTSGQVKVLDFGIAQMVNHAGAGLTATSSVVGTVAYMAPEQVQGRPVDSRCDLYSVGCLLYELLTRRPPHLAETPIAVAYLHAHQDPVPPSRLAPNTPLHVEAAVLRALAKEPGDRFSSADDMRHALLAAPHREPGDSPGSTATTATMPLTTMNQTPGGMSTRHRAARRRTRAAAGAAGLLVVAGTLAAITAADRTGGSPLSGPQNTQTSTGASSTAGSPAQRETPATHSSPSAAPSVTSSAGSSAGSLRVPGDLVGQSLANARAELARLGLSAALAPGSGISRNGIVAATIPPAGTVVSTGDTVLLALAPSNGSTRSASPTGATATASGTATASSAGPAPTATPSASSAWPSGGSSLPGPPPPPPHG